MHVSSNPEDQIPYGADHIRDDHRRRAGMVEIESHDLEKVIVQLEEYPEPLDPDGFTLATGWAGPRTCPSPPSWRSPGRSPPWPSRSRSRRRVAQAPLRRATSGRLAPSGWPHRRLDRVPGAVAHLGLVVFLYGGIAAVFGKDLVINPIFGVFYVWWWVGLVPRSLLFGPVWKAISPVRTINPRSRRFRQRSRARAVHLPRAARLLAGGHRAVRVRLAGARLPALDRARPGAAVGCGYVALMLVGGALFGNVFYERGDPFEVYSRLASGCRRGDAAATGSWCAARSPTWTRCRSRPAWSPWSPCCSEARRSTRSRTRRPGSVRPGRGRSAATCSTTSHCSPSARRGADLRGRHHAHRVGEDPRRDAAEPVRALMVPIVVGYIVAHYLSYLVEVGQLDADPAQRPLRQRQQPARHRQLQVNYWLSYHPTLLANIKVARRRRRPRPRRDRRARPRDQDPAAAAPADRPAAAAGRDDRVHRRRSVPAVRGLRSGRRVGSAE